MVKQKSEFLQWGLMADWKNPYITSDKEFVQHELSVFQQMYDKVSSKQVQVSSFGAWSIDCIWVLEYYLVNVNASTASISSKENVQKRIKGWWEN